MKTKCKFGTRTKGKDDSLVDAVELEWGRGMEGAIGYRQEQGRGMEEAIGYRQEQGRGMEEAIGYRQEQGRKL